MLTVALPEDAGRHGDGRPKVHRFRSHLLELGRRLRAFRERFGLTQDEVAPVIGAGDHATVSQWENGVNVPEGVRRQLLERLLEGGGWTELRGTLINGDGMPASWNGAARWYCRASRERPPRETAGIVIAAALEDLRAAESPEALRQHYRERDGEWIHSISAQCRLPDGHRLDLRQVEDAAYGLRWLEIAHGLRFDPLRALTTQLTVRLLGDRRRVCVT